MDKDLNNILEEYLRNLQQHIYSTADFLDDEIFNIYSYLENSVLRGKLSEYIDESFFDERIKNILSDNFNHIFLDYLNDLINSYNIYSKSINSILIDKNKEKTEKIEEIRKEGNSFINGILYDNASFKRKLMRTTQGLEYEIIDNCKNQIKNKISVLPYSMQDNAYYEMQEKVKIFAGKFENIAYDEFYNLSNCFERNYIDKKIVPLKEEFDVTLDAINDNTKETKNELFEKQEQQFEEIKMCVFDLQQKYGVDEINELISTQSNSKSLDDFCTTQIQTLLKNGEDLSKVLELLDKIGGAMEFIKYREILKEKSEQLENNYGSDILNQVVNAEDISITYNSLLKNYIEEIKKGNLDGEFVLNFLEQVDNKAKEIVNKKDSDSVEIVELGEENTLNSEISNNNLEENILPEAQINEFGEIIRNNLDNEQIIKNPVPEFESPEEIADYEEINSIENNSIYNEVNNAIEKDGLNPKDYYKEHEEYNNPYEDRNFVLDEVRKDGRLLKNAKNFQNDRELVLEAIRSKGSALKYASEDLKNDRDFVLEAIKRKGVALRYASPVLKSDRDFVLNAIKCKSVALKYANPSFKNDRNFVLEAVKNNGLALRYAREFQDDTEIVETAIKQNKNAIKYASLEIQEKYKKTNEQEKNNEENQIQNNIVNETKNNNKEKESMLNNNSNMKEQPQAKFYSDEFNKILGKNNDENINNNNVKEQSQTQYYSDEFDKKLGRNNSSIEEMEIQELLQAKEELLKLKKYIPYENYDYSDNYYKSGRSR